MADKMSGRSETAEGQRLSVRNLTKRFGSITAIENVNLDVAKGEIRALCGGNGAGKSTLVKLLTGVLTPSSGSIVIENSERKFKNPVDAQRAGLSLVAQELSLAPDLSVHDNLWLGHADAPLRRRTSATIERATAALTAVGLGYVAINTKVSTLGLAQRQLLEIARGIVRNASVLILDEPTATLSEQEIKTVFATVRRLRDQGCSIIYITHRMAEVYDLCDTVTVMRNGQVITTCSVNSLNRGELLEMMIGRKLDDVYPVPTSPPGADILTVRNLSVPGNLSDFNLDLRAGEIVGIVGQIGSGAIESIRALAGLEHNASGDVRVRGNPIQLGKPHHALNSGMRFVSEDRAAEGIFLDLASHENLVSTRLNELHRRRVVSPRRLKSVASKLAVSVGFDRNRLHLESGRLSGGNQQKLAVGRCIDRAGTGIVLMNEPTRGVDMGARAEIYETLRKLCEQGNAVLLASTDLEEVVGLVDRIVTLYRGRLVGTHTRGDLSETRILAEITNSKEAA